MNLPGIEWPSTSIKPNCPSPAQHNLFIDILADHGMSQIVDQPTRGENTLDLIAVNYLTLANRTEILLGISDHNAVFAEILILDPKGTVMRRERFPFIRKQFGKELLAKLSPQINIFKSMLTLKVPIVYGINSNLICTQLLRNMYRTNAVPHVIGPHGFLLRYVTF